MSRSRLVLIALVAAFALVRNVRPAVPDKSVASLTRDVGGVKVPYIVRVVGVSPADSMTTYVEKVELNPTVDSARFVKPASK